MYGEFSSQCPHCENGGCEDTYSTDIESFSRGVHIEMEVGVFMNLFDALYNKVGATPMFMQHLSLSLPKTLCQKKGTYFQHFTGV